jgi:hypothetical protein
MVRGTPSTFIRRPIDRNDALYMAVNRKGCFRVVQSAQQRISLPARRQNLVAQLAARGSCVISCPIERHVPASDAALRLLTARLYALFAVENVAEPALAGVHAPIWWGARCAKRRPAKSPVRAATGCNQFSIAIARQAADPGLDPARLARRSACRLGIRAAARAQRADLLAACPASAAGARTGCCATRARR